MKKINAMLSGIISHINSNVLKNIKSRSDEELQETKNKFIHVSVRLKGSRGSVRLKGSRGSVRLKLIKRFRQA